MQSAERDWHEHFQRFLTPEEENRRQLFHECAHAWIGLLHGAQITSFERVPGKTSCVRIAGIRTLEHHYEIGVAGLLAEAKAVMPPKHEAAPFAVGQMRPLAELIYREILPFKEDMDYAIHPHVPFASRPPIRMWGTLSVADLEVPIQQGLSMAHLHDALEAVSERLGDRAEWRRFREYLASIETHQASEI